MAVPAFLPVPAERDPLHDGHVVPEPRRLADHHAGPAREVEGLFRIDGCGIVGYRSCNHQSIHPSTPSSTHKETHTADGAGGVDVRAEELRVERLQVAGQRLASLAVGD